MLLRRQSLSSKGQVTLFILLGIGLLIAIYVVYLVMVNSQSQDSSVLTSAYDFAGISQTLHSCVDDHAQESVYLVASTGGFAGNPSLAVPLSPPVSIHYNSTLNVPLIETITNELSVALAATVPDCLNELSGIMPGMTVTATSDPQVHTTIKEESISFDMQYPVVISYGSSDHKIDQFSSTVTSPRFPLYLKISLALGKEQGLHPKELCMSCIADIAQLYGVQIDFYRTQGAITYHITDPQAFILDQPLTFRMAHDIT